MYLKSIEMQGFKSFPDKTVIQFERGLTGVVGPNGSGKSNISDAMRWVLGEQSSKTLRGTKMEDVIFSGTKSRSPLSFAQVSLSLDNSDRSLDIDNNEVVISRKYYRSGESEYLINKQSVRLRDIHEMLMDTGLGRDGYSIISQGKIAEILSVKSDERREIFEEAAGISKYRYRKEEAEKRLLLAEDNLIRLRDILAELESRVGPLEEQSRKARQFLELSEKKKTVEISIWNETLERSKDVIRDFEGKIYISGQHHEELEEKSRSAEEQIDECYKKTQLCAVEIENMRSHQQNLREEAAQKRSQTAVFANDIGHNEESIERIRGELGGSDDAASAIGEQIAHKEEQRGQTVLLLEELTALLHAAEEELENRKGDEQGYAGKIDEITARIGQLSREQSDCKVEVYSGESTRREIGTSLVTTKEKAAQTAGEAERQKIFYDNQKKELTDWEEKLLSLQNALQGSDMKVKLKRDKLAQVSDKLSEIQAQGQTLTQKLRILKDLENSMEGFSESIKMVLGESSRGQLRGVHGVVSKLIKVEDDYSVAIETALGGALQNIVVENEDSAKACIALLKARRGGRATFLPITSVEARGKLNENLDSYDGYIGVASDLVSCDKKFEKIILNLLGRTAVVDDIDTAVMIAKKCGYRFRIVTLDGQVVNAGGSLTGGSLIRSAGLLSRAAQMEKLAQQIKEVEAKAIAVQEEANKAKREVDEVSADADAIRAEMTVAHENKVRLDVQVLSAGKTLADLQEAASALDAQVTEMQRRLAELEKQIEDANLKFADLSRQVEELTLSLSEYTDLSKQIGATVREKADAISVYRLRMLELSKDIESVDNEIALLKDTHANAQTRREGMLAQMEELEQKNADIAARIAAQQEECAAVDERIASIDTQIGEIIEKRSQLEKEATDLRNGIKGISADKEAVSKDMARLEERLQSARLEYDGIVSRLWEEYEITRTEAAVLAIEITDMAKAKRELNEYKNKIKALGNVNVGAIEEYKEVFERYQFLGTQMDDVEKSKEELMGLVNGLTDEMKKTFTATFEKINYNFGKVFADLFGGGTAELRLSDPEDVLSSGIEITVEPPGKIIKSLTMLSGGEQAFVAIAIYFAILKVRPAPFCILDEIEAALDDVNVYKYAGYLRHMNKRTQFISITHRRGTMEESDVLYGITMQQEGVSKILKLNIDQIEEHLGIK